MSFPDSLGTDFFALDDISADWRVEQSPKKAFLQAMFRRLSMQSLFYDDSYGLGVTRYILDVATPAQRAAEIQAQLLQDERVQSVMVKEAEGKIHVSVFPHTAPTFPFTLTIDQVTTEILLEQ